MDEGQIVKKKKKPSKIKIIKIEGRREREKTLNKLCDMIFMTSHKNSCVFMKKNYLRKSILKHRMIFGPWAHNFLMQIPTFKYKIDCRAP